MVDNPVIAENETFRLTDPATRADLQKAYGASSALNYAGQPPFEELLDRIAAWVDRLSPGAVGGNVAFLGKRDRRRRV